MSQIIPRKMNSYYDRVLNDDILIIEKEDDEPPNDNIYSPCTNYYSTNKFSKMITATILLTICVLIQFGFLLKETKRSKKLLK